MTPEDKPSVFVLMPFDPEFDSIYDGVIKRGLELAGLSVKRADDIQNQRNILRDVFDGIVNSDLIVADLTNLNPNVFYELAIAHAVRKPVILITQNMDEVPFDLKLYRLIEYDVHFAKIGSVIEKLTDDGKAFLAGELQFGNPFSDFSPEYSVHSRPRVPAQESDSQTRSGDTRASGEKDQDDRGLFDHLIDTNEGYIQIATLIGEVSTDLQGLNESLDAAKNEIATISSNPSSSSPVAAQRVLRRLAERISAFNQRLAEANAQYALIAVGIEDSLEFVIGFYAEGSEPRDSNIEEQVSDLRSFKTTAIDGRDSFVVLANTMDQLPRIERRLNREVTRGSEEIRTMAANIDRTIGSVDRALNKFDQPPTSIRAAEGEQGTLEELTGY